MYAYCNNDPVNTVDPFGDSPFSRRLELSDYAFIHFMVQVECVVEYGWDMEIYVKGSRGRGYLDLLDVTTNEFYEVKSEGVYNAGGHIAQMQKYQVAQIANTKRNRVIPGLNIGSGITTGLTQVSGNFQYGAHDVYYYTKKPGIILYKTTYNEQRAQEYMAVGALVAITIMFPQLAPFTSSGAIPLLK